MSSTSLTLSRGIFRFRNAHLTNSQIIHKIAHSIRLEGFQVESTAYFEHPKSAVVKLKGDAAPQNLLGKILHPTQIFSSTHQTIALSVNLSDLERQNNLNQLTYTISCDDARNLNQISHLNRLADRLSRNLIDATKSIETMDKNARYPELIIST